MRERIRRACSVPSAVILVMAFVVPPLLNAADEPAVAEKRAYHLDGEFWTYLAKDTAGVLTAPFSWKASEALCFWAVMGASGLIYAFDGDIQDWVQAQRSPGSDKAMTFFSDMGNAAYIVAFLAGLYATGEIAPSLGLRKTAVLGLESLAVTSVVVVSLKCLMGRARPETGKAPNYFKPFSWRASFLSMPSGHAASAFAAATSIAQQSDSAVVDIAAYTLAAAVALSRVHNNEHWASDVFLGSAIGYFIGRGVAGLNKDQERKTSASLSVSPQSVTMTIRF
ncbi:MAG TPA: phosphatase PAP2 family protein [Acidobacteriota bacterium]